MCPTLSSGNIVIISRLTNNYERFDIVIIEIPDTTIVKRIIGMPGDTVHIRDGHVYINESMLNDVIDQYIDFSGLATSRVKLGKDEYFVLGDNRTDSMDSRHIKVGVVKKKQIVGSVIFSFSTL